MNPSPELIAPAGDRSCALAAVENGADAVYFGLQDPFNARAAAVNFPIDELPALVSLLHRQGVKGYLTLNTLVFSDELPRLEETVRAAAAAGIDAILVQDLGLLGVIHAICPELPLHASTQMSLTSAESIRAAQSFGVRRVVLPRELAIDEIARIRRDTTGVELEAFVHGALCVAYSGQCLTSESLGGRSANRGQCAQACRLTYQLIRDGAPVELGDRKYLLSPRDLAAYDLIPQLIAAGVAAFKIEGRLKSAEYVANITHHYRQAIDAAAAGRPMHFSPKEIEEMEVSFSRGFSHGWLEGANHKLLVPATGSAKRGVPLGEVQEVRKGRVLVKLIARVKRGDGLAFEGDRMAQADQGGRVYEVFRDGRSLTEPVAEGLVELTFGFDAVDLAAVRPGQKVWKTDDPELTRRLRKTFTGGAPRRRVPLDLTITAAVGQTLAIDACAANGAACRVATPEPLAAAEKHPLTADVLRQQFGRLGKTVYELRGVDARISGSPMAPLSVLGALRHELVRQLDASLDQGRAWRVAGEPVLPRLRGAVAEAASTRSDAAVELHVLCREMDQIRVALDCGARSVVADFRDIRSYREAVELARSAGARIALATPRVQKPAEFGLFRVLLGHAPDGILARNLAGLAFCAEQGAAAIADFSLNASNELTAHALRHLGARRVTPAYDLNRDQLADMVAAVPPDWLEVVIHQHMPLFHMEHCVFCALLSPGANRTDCGRPCDRHQVRLRDHVGMEHVLQSDVGCRNTLYNAVPQSAAELVPLLLGKGVRHFRIELLDDDDRAVRRTIEPYRQLLAGQLSGRDVWRALNAANRVGVTRGTLEARRDPRALL